MSRLLLTTALMLGLAAPLVAGVKIENVKPRYGHNGPVRASLDMAPGDEIVFSYTVTGVLTEPDGHLNCEVSQKVIVGDGMVLNESKTPLRGMVGFGGGQFTGDASFSTGLNAAPGVYTLRVTVTDLLREESASFERKVTVQKPGLAILRPRFHRDAEEKVSANLSNITVGDNVFLRLNVVGFNRSRGEIDSSMTIQLFDERGKGLMPNPLKVDLKTADAEKVAQVESLTFNANFTCNRPGVFTVKIVVTDNMTGKSTTLAAPIRVVD